MKYVSYVLNEKTKRNEKHIYLWNLSDAEYAKYFAELEEMGAEFYRHDVVKSLILDDKEEHIKIFIDEATKLMKDRGNAIDIEIDSVYLYSTSCTISKKENNPFYKIVSSCMSGLMIFDIFLSVDFKQTYGVYPEL